MAKSCEGAPVCQKAMMIWKIKRQDDALDEPWKILRRPKTSFGIPLLWIQDLCLFLGRTAESGAAYLSHPAILVVETHQAGFPSGLIFSWSIQWVSMVGNTSVWFCPPIGFVNKKTEKTAWWIFLLALFSSSMDALFSTTRLHKKEFWRPRRW